MEFKFISDEKGALKTIEGVRLLPTMFTGAQYGKILARMFIVRPPAFSAASQSVRVAIIGTNSLVMTCNLPYQLREGVKEEIVEKMHKMADGFEARCQGLWGLAKDLDFLFDLNLRQDQRNMFTPEEGRALSELVPDVTILKNVAEDARAAISVKLAEQFAEIKHEDDMPNVPDIDAYKIDAGFYPVEPIVKRQPWYRRLLSASLPGIKYD